MNKLFLGLAIVSGSLAMAQEVEKEVSNTAPTKYEKEAVRFGIKAGGNSSYFSTQQLSMKNQKLGFNAGVFVNIPLSQDFSLQPEILYNQVGAKSVLNSSEVSTATGSIKTQTDYSTTMSYVAVPVMLQMKPFKNFYVEAGPEFSYYINGKNKGTTSVTTVDGTTTSTQISTSETDINKDDINKFNLGLGLGLGYNFTNNLGINARYINSLTDMRNHKPEGTDPVNHRVFQLGLSYKF